MSKDMKDMKSVRELKPLLKALAIFLFVASILSGFIGFFVLVIYVDAAYPPLTNPPYWILFAFTSIPFCAIGYGIFLKIKAYKRWSFLLNIIGGGIVVVVLVFFGVIFYLIPNDNTHDETLVEKTELVLDIELPPYLRVDTEKDKSYEFEDWEISSYVYFDKTTVREFEETLLTDERWLSVCPSAFVGILPWTNGDMYMVLYNLDTQQCNELPTESGIYRFLYILYDFKEDTMHIIEYTQRYIAL